MAFPVEAPPPPSPPEVLAFLPRDDGDFAGFRAGGLHTPLVVERTVDAATVVAAEGAGSYAAGISSPR